MFTLNGATAYYIGLTFFALAGLCLLYYCCIRSRIKFASTCVQRRDARTRAEEEGGGRGILVAKARVALGWEC